MTIFNASFLNEKFSICRIRKIPSIICASSSSSCKSNGSTLEGYMKNSKWVWSGNITNCRQPPGNSRKSGSTITRHQEDKLSKATSSLCNIRFYDNLSLNTRLGSRIILSNMGFLEIWFWWILKIIILRSHCQTNFMCNSGPRRARLQRVSNWRNWLHTSPFIIRLLASSIRRRRWW